MVLCQDCKHAFALDFDGGWICQRRGETFSYVTGKYAPVNTNCEEERLKDYSGCGRGAVFFEKRESVPQHKTEIVWCLSIAQPT